MKNRLVWKLLLTNIVPVIVVVILVIWLAIDKLAATYFMDLMEKYAISPTEIHAMFLRSIHHYLLWASMVAVMVAFLLSFLLTRRVLRPLSAMTDITVKYAAGDFSSRVNVETGDEVGELGRAFNRMADSLEQVEQLRKNMVADVAHELRTPLTNLCGYFEAFNDQVLPPTPETLQMLHQESLHLMHLVDGLQQLAKADAAKVVLQRTSISLQEEISQVLKLYEHRFLEKGIEVEFDCQPGKSIVADRDKLLQVLRNLIDNCWAHTPAKGWVRVTVSEVEEGMKITCSNSGPGVSNEDLPYIFERFFRTDRSRTRKRGGFGIGLSIARQLVEAHGGRIGAESDDESTTVWFVLPVP